MNKNPKDITILVTGANGQLGSELKVIATYEPYQFIFTDVAELNLTKGEEVNSFFNTHKIDYCINCAAYTAVDKAEKDIAAARAINVEAVQNLAEACTINHTTLFHISTDFVFRGNASAPIAEDMKPDPISVYGFTKLEGENIALKTNPKTVIIRTSWLYSSFGSNFVKTMIRLGRERGELGVVFDQIGSPTYAGDLAKAIVSIIQSADIVDLDENYGVYHYSNEGVASWYDFAKAIFEMKSMNVVVKPLKTEEYPTPAKRPHYTVMDKSKIKNTFRIKLPYWRDSLKLCLELLDD
jgi:dTDP-4-dehydrorhamnose reductase